MGFQFLFLVVVAYGIGSIPTAFLLVKWRYRLNLMEEGTGNSGAFNVLRTTKSRGLSVAVLALDFCKGVVVMVLARGFLSAEPFGLGAMAVAAVLGHNYSIWLGFRGGRGLATGAGILALILPQGLLVWLLVWVISYLMTRQIISSSVIATVGVLIFLWLPGTSAVSLRVAVPVSIIAVLVIIKHIPRLKEVWRAESTRSAVEE